MDDYQNNRLSTDTKREIRMQEITFTKANELHLKDCRDALCQSTLGERYFSSPGSAEDAILAVKEEYRNRGIGKALLDYSERIAHEMADKFFLVVADYNPDAKRFYERNGYRQVGVIPNLYRPGVTEYMMEKDLKK